MQVNVSQLLKSAIGSVRDYTVSGEVDVKGDGAVSSVNGEVRLTRTNRGILVKGALHTEAEATCSRCLALFRCALVLNIEDEYFPTVDVVSGASLAVPDEPGCFIIDGQHVIDLTEAIRQYTLLVIPMKPLCRQDCSGLCPVCGHNLNLGRCNCPVRQADHRWAGLTRLAGERKGTD